MALRPGKLPSPLLERLLRSVSCPDASVVLGPAVGEDAAVIDTGGPELLAVKTDPITFAREDAPHYLLAVNCNDLATVGAKPRWLLVTALLPEGVTESDVEALFRRLRQACETFGVALIGGHTEVTVGLDRPILVGGLLGTVAREALLHTAAVRAGDAIVLAGAIAVEGTALLAREHGHSLRAAGLKEEWIERAARLLDAPGISVLPAAQAARSAARIHAMHDPTEGGLAMALHELADAAGVGLRVYRDAIPVLEECSRICEALQLDPLGLLASGALLIALHPADVASVLDRLREAGIRAARIADAVEPVAGRILVTGDRESALPRFDRDELARFLERFPAASRPSPPPL
ncbi:MAG: AIR synthase-related protein [Bryobacterales bacterium]|nr:AIR synthase-related protein [Bryobacteraceae bacterium]MDW8355474.1 AIR synthase-related protein [Bryobacterales bacterium]